MKRFYELLVILIFFVIAGCSSNALLGLSDPVKTETSDMVISNTPTPDVTISPSHSSTISPTQENITYDIKSGCIRLVDQNYELEKILDTAFGLPFQIAPFTNGEFVLSEGHSNTLTILSEGSYRKLFLGDYELSPAVATLSDGRIVYSQGTRVEIVDPVTGEMSDIGSTPTGHDIRALAVDSTGNIFAATSTGSIFEFSVNESERTQIISNLPYGRYQITDMDVAENGTIYVAGFGQVTALTDDSYSVIASDLNYEPVWVEISADGTVFINDLANGVQQYNPATQRLVQLSNIPAFGDMISLSSGELIFYHWTGSYYRYDFQTKEIKPYFINSGSSFVLAASGDGSVYFSAPNFPEVHDTTVMSVNEAGEITKYENLSYPDINSADFDFDQNLCLATYEELYCYKNGTLVRSIQPSKNVFGGYGSAEIALAPNGYWYIIKAKNQDNTINVYRVDETGHVTTLPLSFSLSTFGDAYEVSDVSIDVGSDGSLAIIVTALGSKNEGPYYQRIYRADAKGENAVEVANLDSGRIAGMVDIAIDSNDVIYVLNVQGGTSGFNGDPIYQIDAENEVSPLVDICAGLDPKSLDVDANGNIWFSTTTGIFRVVPVE